VIDIEMIQIKQLMLRLKLKVFVSTLMLE